MSTIPARTLYPSDVSVSDGTWAFVAPYFTLLQESAGQRSHTLREVFNSLRAILKTAMHWRMLPHDLTSQLVVYQQM